MYDFSLIRKDAHSVRDAVPRANAEISTTAGEHSPSAVAFRGLMRLDSVRARMESTRVALKEAENWSTLAAELEAIFAVRDYDRAAERLQEAARSLVLLSQAPDHDDRRALLGKLRNQLEAAVSPQIMAALTERDAEAVARFRGIFEKMGRGAEFAGYYNRSRAAPLARLWGKFDEEDALRAPEDPATPGRRFVEWLPSFYEEAFLVLNK
ncbi:oligomeric Golgi complex subunit 7, partial [Blyttiomyces helicus]